MNLSKSEEAPAFFNVPVENKFLLDEFFSISPPIPIPAPNMIKARPIQINFFFTFSPLGNCGKHHPSALLL
jgi:hypothetical protein